MASKKQNPLRVIGRQIWSIMPIHAFNTQDQNPQTWAKVIRSYESLPVIFQDFVRSALFGKGEFPYMVLTPAYEKSGDTITGKLICVIDQALLVLEENAEKMVAICYPVDRINYVEVSSKLLEYRVTINGVTDLGIESASIFRCSTVTDHLFAPILERIRPRSVSSSGNARTLNIGRFEQWSGRNYKFMNLARHCMLPDETVIVSLLQPEIHSGLFSFPDRPFRRVKSPTHACILTKKELIMIREDLLQSRKDKYGGTCNFLPLNKILSISMSRKTGNLLAVSIQLVNHECFDCLFDSSFENDVENLVAHTRERIPGERTRVLD